MSLISILCTSIYFRGKHSLKEPAEANSQLPVMKAAFTLVDFTLTQKFYFHSNILVHNTAYQGLQELFAIKSDTAHIYS